MDSENNKNTSLQLLHAYDSSDSSDESNQNISEKYLNTKIYNIVSKSNSCDGESEKKVPLNNENDNLTISEIATGTNDGVSNTAEESKSNNNHGFSSDIENVDMAHREVKPWIGNISCDDDDDDDDSDSSSSSEWESLKGDEINSSDSDDENSNARGGITYINKKIQPKVKGELGIEDLPPIEDLTISVPNEQCVPFGTIHDIVDQLVIVKTLPDKPTLDLDTILFLDEGSKPLGHIFDVFGQVTQPYYCIRFNSSSHIKDKGIEKGMTVYFAPKTEFTNLVYTPDLMRAKGSDASWKDDVEVPEQLCDYSDDEAERKAKQALKDKKKKTESVSCDDGETSSGSKKPKLTPFEVKMNKINLEKTAELNKMNNYRMLCGRGRGLVMMMMEQHNNMEIRSRGQGRGRSFNLFADLQRAGTENSFQSNPFDVPHGFRLYPTHCPRFPPIPGSVRNPITINNRPTFSPPPVQSFPRPSMPPLGRNPTLNPRYRSPPNPFFPHDRQNF